MNIFYASPAQIHADIIELRGQEAMHASKALRYKPGDDITVVDGQGGWYEGKVQLVADQSVRIVIEEQISVQRRPEAVMGIGIIKKRDRLEFAVEKAVELGVKEIALFKGEHSIKKGVRIDRLESIVISAMKQSLRSWLPQVGLFKTLRQLVENYSGANIIAAHETEKKGKVDTSLYTDDETLLLAGPEGGFSDAEVHYLRNEKAGIVSLGKNRLRTETAAITLLNQYNYLKRC